MDCGDGPHHFQFLGVVWHHGAQLPGSGAHEVIYEDRFHCLHCLIYVDKQPRVVGNSYQKPIPGSLPK